MRCCWTNWKRRFSGSASNCRRLASDPSVHNAAAVPLLRLVLRGACSELARRAWAVIDSAESGRDDEATRFVALIVCAANGSGGRDAISGAGLLRAELRVAGARHYWRTGWSHLPTGCRFGCGGLDGFAPAWAGVGAEDAAIYPPMQVRHPREGRESRNS